MRRTRKTNILATRGLGRLNPLKQIIRQETRRVLGESFQKNVTLVDEDDHRRRLREAEAIYENFKQLNDAVGRAVYGGRPPSTAAEAIRDLQMFVKTNAPKMKKLALIALNNLDKDKNYVEELNSEGGGRNYQVSWSTTQHINRMRDYVSEIERELEGYELSGKAPPRLQMIFSLWKRGFSGVVTRLFN